LYPDKRRKWRSLGGYHLASTFLDYNNLLDFKGLLMPSRFTMPDGMEIALIEGKPKASENLNSRTQSNEHEAISLQK
jgi:hypothetical protein